MNVGDRITTKRKNGHEWLVVGQKAGMLSVVSVGNPHGTVEGSKKGGSW